MIPNNYSRYWSLVVTGSNKANLTWRMPMPRTRWKHLRHCSVCTFCTGRDHRTRERRPWRRRRDYLWQILPPSPSLASQLCSSWQMRIQLADAGYFWSNWEVMWVTTALSILEAIGFLQVTTEFDFVRRIRNPDMDCSQWEWSTLNLNS